LGSIKECKDRHNSLGENLSIKCDNGIKAYLGQPIFSGACYRGEATQKVTIGYVNAIGDVFETDILYLCDHCTKLARKTARRHNYKFKTENL